VRVRLAGYRNLIENRFVNRLPPAVKETEPVSFFLVAERGVL
jgi:hypothetical protein